MNKPSTTVTILGREYTIVGGDSDEHIRRVAIYVDRKMQEIGERTHRQNLDLAVLSAMNLADELFRTQDENTRLRKELLLLKQREHSATQLASSQGQPARVSPPQPNPRDIPLERRPVNPFNAPGDINGQR